MKIEDLEAYQRLSDDKKKLLDLLLDPGLTRQDVATQMGVTRQTVYNFLNSAEYHEINEHIAIAKKTSLLTYALKAFEDCLKSKNENVKLKASLAVLVDAGVIRPEGSAAAGPKPITVVWEKNPNAVNNQLPAPAQATGDPPGPDKV